MNKKQVLFMRLRSGDWVGFRTTRKRRAAYVLKTFHNKIGIDGWQLVKSGDISSVYPDEKNENVFFLN